MVTLTNQHLQVNITPKGAELSSIYNKQTGLEYLWNGNPEFWAKQSPTLFPIVGGLKNGSYQFAGKQYAMGRHGFTREMFFVVSNQTNLTATFTIEATEETLKQYPFQFLFSVTYSIEGNKLSVTYTVKNSSSNTLYFSVGAHPAFKVPLVQGDAYDDYYLAFNETENAGIYPLTADGLVELRPVPCLENTNKLPLTKTLFYKDALVFKELKSTAISILNTKNSHGLTYSYTDFPYMGIWAAKNADFVCIEPWCGIADNVATTSQFAEKEGINTLASNETFTKTWAVEMF
ncbi:MAG: aldose 1-epimerase family protein [Flavobacterium sp.]|nr:aldose 1-epimerase family protein [Flavobacterium sp.]